MQRLRALLLSTGRGHCYEFTNVPPHQLTHSTARDGRTDRNHGTIGEHGSTGGLE